MTKPAKHSTDEQPASDSAPDLSLWTAKQIVQLSLADIAHALVGLALAGNVQAIRLCFDVGDPGKSIGATLLRYLETATDADLAPIAAMLDDEA